MGDPSYLAKQSTAPAPRPKQAVAPPKPKASADDLVRSSAMFRPDADPAASIESLEDVPYVHHGAVCRDEPTKPGCFLDADGDTERRGRLIVDYKSRVLGAKGNYVSALQSLALDLRLEKDGSDLPWVLELIFDVVGAHALGAALAASGRIATADAGVLRGMITDDSAIVRMTTKVAGALQPAVAAAEPAALDHLAKMAVGAGKASAIGRAKAELASRERSERARGLDYIGRLVNEADSIFVPLAELVPGAATDAELVVFWEAFAREKHSVDLYRDALGDKLERFRASGVDKLGRDREWRDEQSVVRDRKLVRVEYASGYPPRFAYARTDWFVNTANTTPAQRDVRPSSLPIPADPRTDHPDTEIALLTASPEIESLVDPEFADVATERHRQLWGADPATIVVDDSTYVWEPARAMQARANLRARRSP